MTSRTGSGAAISQTADHAYTLKILYGPLCGLEMTLAPGRHFFVTASDGTTHGEPDTNATLDTSALAQSPNTYLVPGPLHLDARTPNFAIVVGAEPNRPDCTRSLSHAGHEAPDIEAIIEIHAHEPSPTSWTDDPP
ncbi:MAG TPA: hypothetical protein VL424_05830, partial [Pararobbsia sp.]|nr:hypothetical protein [Pararobbsia sp.]